MTGIWKQWIIIWCLAVGTFGLVLTLGALPATDLPVRILLSALAPDQELVMTPHLRFCLAVMGPVTLGWCATLFGAIYAANKLNHANSRVVWIYITAGVLLWSVIDSILSIATGFAFNIIPNSIYVATYFIPVIASGVLSKN